MLVETLEDWFDFLFSFCLFGRNLIDFLQGLTLVSCLFIFCRDWGLPFLFSLENLCSIQNFKVMFLLIFFFFFPTTQNFIIAYGWRILIGFDWILIGFWVDALFSLSLSFHDIVASILILQCSLGWFLLCLALFLLLIPIGYYCFDHVGLWMTMIMIFSGLTLS